MKTPFYFDIVTKTTRCKICYKCGEFPSVVVPLKLSNCSGAFSLGIYSVIRIH